MSRFVPAETAVLDVPHADECWGDGWCYVPGYKDIPATVYRDRRGRNHQHNSHSFLVLVCLDPSCPGRALLSERSLSEWVNTLLPKPAAHLSDTERAGDAE